MPSLREPIAGCAFAPRCPLAHERCVREAPALRALAPGHWAACHVAEQALPGGRGMSGADGVLTVTNLSKHFPVRRGLLKREVASVKAVDGVSFSLPAGSTLCVVGESGCGKSTVGRWSCAHRADSGQHRLHGEDITKLSSEAVRPFRQKVQMVFQDPFASLNPRLRAGTIVGEPLENFGTLDGKARRERVEYLFGKVGLRADAMQKFPFEFSGGQRQRLGIARALALSPSVIVADEPVSALDVSVQAQVLNLLMDLQAEMQLAYLFISHDLGVGSISATIIAVMYLGRIVEMAPKKTLFAAPQHPYTRALLSAATCARSARQARAHSH